jgi:hypothetical protein
VKEIARHVAVVNRLDHDLHPGLLRLLGGPGEVRGVNRPRRDRRNIRGHQACHAVDQAAVQGLRIVERAFDPLAELGLPPGQAGESPLARRPIPGGQVEQRLDKPVRLQPPPDLGGWMIIGKQELHRLEARRAGGVEAIQEVRLVEHHRQVRGKAWHCSLPLTAT